MNYYPFHVGDYRRDTHYLTHEGHYIYRTLLDEYYHSERPLPLDKRALLRKLGLTTDQMPLLEEILNDFFMERSDGYINKHCERVIGEYKAKVAQARVAGTASGKARKRKRTGVQRALKSRSTGVEQKGNGRATNQEPRTKNQEPLNNKKQKTIVELKPDDPVKGIFVFWKTEHNHPRAAFDDKRKALIRKQLKGYTAEDLKQAITGCKLTPHNMGDNDRSEVYDSIELILRDAAHIDRFMANALNPPGQARDNPKDLSEYRADGTQIIDSQGNRVT